MAYVVRFLRQVKRGFKYFKLGYNTYPYDYEYTKQILAFSLKEQLKLFESPQSPVNWYNEERERRAIKALKLTIKLLESPEFISKNLPSLSTKSFLQNGHYCLTFLNSQEDLDKFKKLNDMANKINSKREKLCYDIIVKYNRYWWD